MSRDQLTEAQRVALERLRERFPDMGEPFPISWGAVMVKAAGMFIGIEKDGYTHT